MGKKDPARRLPHSTSPWGLKPWQWLNWSNSPEKRNTFHHWTNLKEPSQLQRKLHLHLPCSWVTSVDQWLLSGSMAKNWSLSSKRFQSPWMDMPRLKAPKPMPWWGTPSVCHLKQGNVSTTPTRKIHCESFTLASWHVSKLGTPDLT